MSVKVFISYSHHDEEDKDELVKHLSLLKRNGHIDDWHDREIDAGIDWKASIDSALESSEIIILLVSSNFLHSDYCMDVELEQALARHQTNKARVVPVVVRPCDWKDSGFSKLEVLPRDGRPIVKWDDKDDAWLDVVEGLKKVITAILKTKTKMVSVKLPSENCLTSEFHRWLQDTEVQIVHPRLGEVRLSDIYVPPDLRIEDYKLDGISKSINTSEAILNSDRLIIFGDEQSGKTSLIKFLFSEYQQRGFSPVVFRGEEVSRWDASITFDKARCWQYGEETLSGDDKRFDVLIVDDFQNVKLNRKYTNKFLTWIEERFPRIVLVAGDTYRFVMLELRDFKEYSRYEISTFGHVKRDELIGNWVALGNKEGIPETDLHARVDYLKEHIDAFVRKNIVPSKPLYILSILQSFEAVNPQRLEMTSYGHCYRYLIYQALERVNIPQAQIDSHINYLTELAIYLFNQNLRALDADHYNDFLQSYQNNFLSVDFDWILKNLLRSNILIMNENLLAFKYRFIYYFFAAKYLAENLSEGLEAKQQIQRLIQYLHKEDCSNIIVFLTHHTKETWVLDEIQIGIMELFAEYNEATLKKDQLGFMVDFLDKIPEIVVEKREVEKERRKYLERRDMIDGAEEELGETVEEEGPDELFASINKTFQGMIIIGQIIRTRHGSLDKVRIKSLISEAYSVGLRFLQYFLEISDRSKQSVAKAIEDMLQENLQLDNRQIEKAAKDIFLSLTYAVVFGMLKQIGRSVGSGDAIQGFREITNEDSTPAVKLITQSIEMWFTKVVDIKSLRKLTNSFDNNIVCNRMLKELVVQHIYMHHVDYRKKQQIAEALGIPVKGQRSIELKKAFEM
ncbi:TIR domain-containing protein [Candidatus Thiosymbion oneisti]|uniref:TIR domain-containing protein n=1 Tax=Candidatus Thiosymbion oneisti TaxID=589554 RepID=UPI00105F690A|nr:TIR domain-containing protein [Candidatus Thiosymbion oneisti]